MAKFKDKTLTIKKLMICKSNRHDSWGTILIQVLISFLKAMIAQ